MTTSPSSSAPETPDVDGAEVDQGHFADQAELAELEAEIAAAKAGKRIPVIFTRQSRFAWMLLISGIIGIIATGILTVESFHKFENPAESLVCDINPFITGGPALLSDAGRVFGFPNLIFGFPAFAVCVTTAMAIWAGARMRRWYWIGMQCGVIFAAALITYLQWYSVEELQRLCLWCMIIWFATIPLVVAVTFFNSIQGYYGSKIAARAERLSRWWGAFVALWDILLIVYIVVGLREVIALTFA